jgi:hypothetical protein
MLQNSTWKWKPKLGFYYYGFRAALPGGALSIVMNELSSKLLTISIRSWLLKTAIVALPQMSLTECCLPFLKNGVSPFLKQYWAARMSACDDVTAQLQTSAS